MIPVSKAFLPPREELNAYIDKIYESGVVTNNGPLVNLLEQRLKDFLGVKHLFLVGNATIGLQVALRALELPAGSEVINSAFSFVAAPSAIVSNSCVPVFADIKANTFCIDVNSVKKKLTEQTSAILPTHLFNSICELDKLAEMAKKHNLPIIYDAAHSFGIRYNGRSIFCYGDISVCSLHAFKVFGMGEGGFICTEHSHIAEKIYEARYFGLSKENQFSGVGYNAKNSELHAAMGLAGMPYIEELFADRQQKYFLYKRLLSEYDVRFQWIPDQLDSNYSYVAIVFKNGFIRERVEHDLMAKGISSKRYFAPALHQLPFYHSSDTLANAEELADCILCLPNYFGLEDRQIMHICEQVIHATRS